MAANTSLRVHETARVHVQPVPLALVGVNPVGSESLTVTVPLVALPLFVTDNVKDPVPPRMSIGALAVFVIVKSGPAAVPIVTEPLAAVESPPPLTEAVFVSDAPAFAATLAWMVIAG